MQWSVDPDARHLALSSSRSVDKEDDSNWEIGNGDDRTWESLGVFENHPRPSAPPVLSDNTQKRRRTGRRLGPLTSKQRVAVSQTREKGACRRCRKFKIPCGIEDPCDACKKVSFYTRDHRFLCLRGPLTRLLPVFFSGASSGTVVMKVGYAEVQELLTDIARQFLIRVRRLENEEALVKLAAIPLAGESAIVHIEKVGELIQRLEDFANTGHEPEDALLISSVIMIVTRVYLECQVRDFQFTASERSSGPSGAPAINTRSWAPALETLFDLVFSGVEAREYIDFVCIMAGVESGPDMDSPPRLDSRKTKESGSILVPITKQPIEYRDRKMGRSLCEQLRILYFRHELVQQHSGEHTIPANRSVDEIARDNQSGEGTSRQPQDSSDSRLTNDFDDLPHTSALDLGHGLSDPNDDLLFSALSASDKQRGEYREIVRCDYCDYQASTVSEAKCVDALE